MRCHGSKRIVLVVGWLLSAAPGWAGDGVERCVAAKRNAAGAYAYAALKCHRDAARLGEPVDGNCIAKSHHHLLDAFARAESPGGCLTTGDVGAVGNRVDAFLSDVVAALRPVPNANTCAALKVFATGRGASGQMRCHQRAVRHGINPTGHCLGREATKVADTFARAETVPPCLTTGDAAAVLALLDALGDDVGALLPVPIAMVSVSTKGVQGNSSAFAGVLTSLSDDGRFVTFVSPATNLVAGTGAQAGFLHDRDAGTTTLVYDQVYTSTISGDASLFVFICPPSGDPSEHPDICSLERASGDVEVVSTAVGGGESYGIDFHQVQAVSLDGRYVVWESDANDLVPGPDMAAWDCFVRDRMARTTSRVSESSDGTQSNGGGFRPIISTDGRFVAFSSGGYNLVPNDTNAHFDCFVRDLLDGTTSRASVASDESEADSRSDCAAISGDGRFVVFSSTAGNLGAASGGAAQLFLRDRQLGVTEHVTVAFDGSSPADNILLAAISRDGRFVAFASDSDAIVPDDTNGHSDIFVRDRDSGMTTRVSSASDGAQANGDSYVPAIAGDGSAVAFWSDATNLVPVDRNGKTDVFVRRLLP
jgi:hypothetical protein